MSPCRCIARRAWVRNSSVHLPSVSPAAESSDLERLTRSGRGSLGRRPARSVPPALSALVCRRAFTVTTSVDDLAKPRERILSGSVREEQMQIQRGWTCPKCSQAFPIDDAIVSIASLGERFPHWSCQSPRVLRDDERALLFGHGPRTGYLASVACSCGARLERWVTPREAERDLFRFVSLN